MADEIAQTNPASVSHLPPSLGARYQLERRLPVGIHGPSWLARDAMTNGRMVLRYITGLDGAQSSLVALLRNTTSLAASCPATAPTLDLVAEGGSAWLVREWVSGESLAEALATLGTLNLAQARSLIGNACRGVVTESGAAMVHGHLCPENLLIDTTGTVRIVDAGLHGIARVMGGQARAYLAPEVVSGEMPSLCSDVYALGALLYLVLCGRYPLAFTGDEQHDLAVLRTHEILPPPMRSPVSGPMGNVIWRALQPAPADRFGSAQELLQAISAAAAAHPDARRGLRRLRFFK